mgnify:CR=1 FL=1
MNKKIVSIIGIIVVGIPLICFAIGEYTYNYIEENRNEVELNWSEGRIAAVNKISNLLMHKNFINVIVPDGTHTGLPKKVGTRTESGFVRESEDEITYTMKDGRKIIFDVNETAYDRVYSAMIAKYKYSDKKNYEYVYMNYYRHYRSTSGPVGIGFANNKEQFEKLVPVKLRLQKIYHMQDTNVVNLDFKKEENSIFIEYLFRAMIDGNLMHCDNEELDRVLRMIGKERKA